MFRHQKWVGHAEADQQHNISSYSIGVKMILLDYLYKIVATYEQYNWSKRYWIKCWQASQYRQAVACILIWITPALIILTAIELQLKT